jgi:hypothetical protein
VRFIHAQIRYNQHSVLVNSRRKQAFTGVLYQCCSVAGEKKYDSVYMKRTTKEIYGAVTFLSHFSYFVNKLFILQGHSVTMSMCVRACVLVSFA